jgi:hypothetical protein
MRIRRGDEGVRSGERVVCRGVIVGARPLWKHSQGMTSLAQQDRIRRLEPRSGGGAGDETPGDPGRATFGTPEKVMPSSVGYCGLWGDVPILGSHREG